MFLAIICSLSSWCQTTIPVFTVAHELFQTHVTSVSNIVNVLKKHGLATDKSWMPTGQNLNMEHLENVTYGGNNKTIVTQVTYDCYINKTIMVKFVISSGYDYYSTFLSYLEKNNYELSDRNSHISVYKNVNKNYTCGITTSSYPVLEVGFINKNAY